MTSMPFDREVQAPATDGLTTAVSLAGDLSAGIPVVLLHGLSQQRWFWAPTVRRMRYRPVISVDLRGHGASSAGVDADFGIARVAADVIAVLDDLAVPTVHVVGHSWGAAVALHLCARFPDRMRTCALIDGGLWSIPEEFGSRAEARARLRPPELGMPADELWARISDGDLRDVWGPETREALEPTFVVDDDGRIRTRIGMARHLAVLDGLLDHDTWADADQVSQPIWFAKCLPTGPVPPPVQRTLDRAAGLPNVLTHRWQGACHDVPLQWPALVAGFVEALIESRGQQ